MIWFDLILCYKNHTHTMITPTPQTIHRNHDEINSVRSQSTRLISTHRHSSNYLSSLVGNGLWRPGALQKWIYTGIVQWLRFAIDHSFPTPPLKFALRGEIGIFFLNFQVCLFTRGARYMWHWATKYLRSGRRNGLANRVLNVAVRVQTDRRVELLVLNLRERANRSVSLVSDSRCDDEQFLWTRTMNNTGNYTIS